MSVLGIHVFFVKRILCFTRHYVSQLKLITTLFERIKLIIISRIFSDVWKMNVKESGFLITITFAASFISDVTCSLTADYLTDVKTPYVTLVRIYLHTLEQQSNTSRNITELMYANF